MLPLVVVFSPCPNDIMGGSLSISPGVFAFIKTHVIIYQKTRLKHGIFQTRTLNPCFRSGPPKRLRSTVDSDVEPRSHEWSPTHYQFPFAANCRLRKSNSLWTRIIKTMFNGFSCLRVPVAQSYLPNPLSLSLSHYSKQTCDHSRQVFYTLNVNKC
jgi:hypothetical protein